WTVALENAVRREPVRDAFAFDLLRRLAERKRLALRDDIGEEQLVMSTQRIERPAERYEVAWNERSALVDQLIEGMLAVGSRLSPIDRARGVSRRRSVERDVLAVAFHRQLLQVRREPLQVLLVRQNRDGLGAEEIRVPNRQQA